MIELERQSIADRNQLSRSFQVEGHLQKVELDLHSHSDGRSLVEDVECHRSETKLLLWQPLPDGR